MKVLILGGYGVFGGRLAQMLLRDGVAVIIAGRRLEVAQSFATKHGGKAVKADRDTPATVTQHLDPGDICVDAAGPFQDSTGLALPEAVVAKRCHYLDLSDDAAFTASIFALDAMARGQGVVALSGLSSVPALSSAVVQALRGDVDEIALIETAILPGNRAPRGRSVMRAILQQVGRPLTQWRGGAWVDTTAWGPVKRFKLPGGLTRAASPISVPDLMLFPKAYGARSVRFWAGLELPVMHHGLRVLGWLHRLGLLPRLDRFVAPLGWGADLLRGFGSDRGGMVVVVAGRTSEGRPLIRRWRFTLGRGQGPKVPALPALLVIRQLTKGDVPAGARPALRAISLDAAEAELKALGAVIEQSEEAHPPLFQRALGPEVWATMPPSFRHGHDLWDRHVMTGRGSVERGQGRLAMLVAALFRFPPAAPDVAVTVVMERIGDREIWRRDFGGNRFLSKLSYAGPASLHERFGPFTFELSLPLTEGRMGMQVEKGWFLGIPIPRVMLPISETEEFEAEGRFNFSVRLSAPLAGFVVHYRGWLKRQP